LSLLQDLRCAIRLLAGDRWFTDAGVDRGAAGGGGRRLVLAGPSGYRHFLVALRNE
jgi:hypothetical protein